MSANSLPPLVDFDTIAALIGLVPGKWLCPLPGHDRWANLIDGTGPREGDLVLVCDCKGNRTRHPWSDPNEWLGAWQWCLADVYWSLQTGLVLDRGVRIEAGLRYVSRLLMTGDLGLIAPAPLELAPIPEHLSAVYHRGREFFGRLYGLSAKQDPLRLRSKRGIGLPKRWLAAWLRCSDTEAMRVIHYLRSAHVIEHVGWDRQTYLYAPYPLSDHQGAGRQPSNSQRARSRSNERITGLTAEFGPFGSQPSTNRWNRSNSCM